VLAPVAVSFTVIQAPDVAFALDHLILAVADLKAATQAWADLLGRAPSWRGSHPALGSANTLFRFGGSYLELLAADPAREGLLGGLVRDALDGREERPFGLALGTPDVDAAATRLRAHGVELLDPADGEGREQSSGVTRTWRSALVPPESVRGVRMLVLTHTSPTELLPIARPVADDATSVCEALDHAVVFTEDLGASIRLWTDAFGLADAWSQDFPERKTRNRGLLFGPALDGDGGSDSSSAPILELIERSDREPRGRSDVLWGVAFRVGDCAAAVRRLRARGVAIDEPRAGLLPGTTVATVRWSRTPTLLVSPT
jgi:catechol 2,3-dioxygenase-like lactoylglutathione lyase family enzyme